MDLFDILQTLGLFFMCLVIVHITYVYYTWPYSVFKNAGIPGPKPRPFVGTSGEVGKRPVHEIDTERVIQYGKVVGTFEGWLPALIISDVDMLKEIFIKDFDSFSDRMSMTMQGYMTFNVFNIKGLDNWKRQRSQLSKYFSTQKMKMSMKTLNKILERFITKLKEKCDNKEQFECRSMTDLYTMDAICNTAYGVDVDSTSKSSEIVNQAKLTMKSVTTGNIYFIIMGLFPTLANILDFFKVEVFDLSWFDKFVSILIKQRKASNDDCPDFVNTLLKAQDIEHTIGSDQPHNKGMNDKEIIGNATLFLFAGYDTTSSSLSFLLYNLTAHEQYQDKVYTEIQQIIGDEAPTYDNVQQLEYLDMCIEESLRLYPIATRVDRQCVKDTVVKGIPIKKGTLIVLPIWYLHRNADIYQDPDRFDPERFSTENKKGRDPFHYCPFGIGPRHCIGMRLALLEIKLAVVKILQNFKLMKNDKTQIPLKLKKDAFNLTAQDGIWISLEKR